MIIATQETISKLRFVVEMDEREYDALPVSTKPVLDYNPHEMKLVRALLAAMEGAE